VEAGRARHGPEPVEVATEPDRRPVHQRPTACVDERPRLLDRLVDLQERLAGLRRRVEEQVLVGVAGSELGGVDVPEDGADDHAAP
jgi:hypothetical protein